jgi:hypothetical protein
MIDALQGPVQTESFYNFSNYLFIPEKVNIFSKINTISIIFREFDLRS